MEIQLVELLRVWLLQGKLVTEEAPKDYAVSILHREQTCRFLLLEKVPQDLFHSVYFEYEENCTHDRLLSLNYAFCHVKRLLKTREPVYRDKTVHRNQFN